MRILINSHVSKSILQNIFNGCSQCRPKHASVRLIIRSLSHTLKLNCSGISEGKSIEEIDKLLNRSEVKEYLEVMKMEYDKLGPVRFVSNPVLSLLEKLKENENYIKDLSDMYNNQDRGMCELVKCEKEKYEEASKRLNYQLLQDSVPKRAYDDCRDITLHVTAGVGGQEAKLFAGEIFDMYLKYALFKNWSVNYVRKSETEMGGVSSAEAYISGDLAFFLLQNEAGIHRVQRVPETEKAGKVHTSTCKVNVLPDVAINEIVLKESDLKFDYSRSSGAGGQNVNKLETKVRITYLPTGYTVEAQEKRSQVENKKLALRNLKWHLYEEKCRKHEREITALKKNQAATVDRSDKIRTYNFLKNRITDHRIHFSSHNIELFFQGTYQLNEMIIEMSMKNKETYLLNEINKILKHGNVKEILKAC